MSALDREAPTSRGEERTPSPEPSTGPSATIEADEPTATPDPEPGDEQDDASDEAAEAPEPEAEPTDTPEPTAVGELYATVSLNVRAEPSTGSDVVTVLARGAEVTVTDTTDGDWVLVMLDDETAWVNADYLSETKPEDEPEDEGEDEDQDDGISYAECQHGSSVEAGLTQNAIRVHRAVCARYPEVTSYGGLRPGDSGAHGSGRALDIMVTGSLGDAIAAWVRENHRELGVSEVIWAQRIWTVERSGEGWRWMGDRGSATANHYDHVHVTVYGN